MTILRLTGDFNNPELTCDSCDANFHLYWQRSLIHTKVMYCPFCGDEVEEVEDELK